MHSEFGYIIFEAQIVSIDSFLKRIVYEIIFGRSVYFDIEWYPPQKKKKNLFLSSTTSTLIPSISIVRVRVSVSVRVL